ncbi:hypothetical protein HD806DRAFT_478422 [Xylariaceae sp. AK1471]|nr:hypothetical protein HD806DRAFT_478422 [Xylariaceae sp. AK1471]
MPLLDLPVELLSQIIQESTPEGFENLVLSCKRLYTVGHSFIGQHSTRKKKYKNVTIVATNSLVGLYWLDQIALEPILPLYMNNVDLRGQVSGIDYDIDADTRQISTEMFGIGDPHLMIQRVKGIIERSRYLAFEGLDPSFWTEQILSDVGDHDQYSDHHMFLGLLFLTLLPNVTNLTLPWISEPWALHGDGDRSRRECKRLLDVLRDEGRSGRACRALGKLKRLNYRLRPNYDVREPLESILPLLVLPKLEELYASSLVAIDFFYDLVWPYAGIESNLKTIHLAHCCMDAKSISEFLAHMPHLTSFKYAHAAKHHGLGAYWDAGEFVAAVEKQVGHQLRHLAITIEPRTINSIDAGVTSMHGFVQLETLDIDFMVFCGPSIESGEKGGLLNTPPKPGYPKWAMEFIPPIHRIFPKCLRRLDLFVDPSNGIRLKSTAVIYLTSGFRSARSSMFPNISHFTVHVRSEPIGTLNRACLHDLDSLCGHLDGEGIEYRFDLSAMPPWRGDYIYPPRGV